MSIDVSKFTRSQTSVYRFGIRTSRYLAAVPWRFLTNHGRLLLCLAQDPSLRIRDLALILGITERSTQKIVGDLVADGYLTRKRIGRRNEYEVHVEMPLPLGRELAVHHVLETFRLDEDAVKAVSSAGSPNATALPSASS